MRSTLAAGWRIKVYGLPIFGPRRVFSPGKAPTPPPVGTDWLSPAANALNTANNANLSAAYDTWNVIKATTLNAGNPWKVTLPVPALSGGNIQFVAVQIDAASTQLVSLVGNAGTENIGPGTATSRLLWAGECAVLYTDGTNWFKVAGEAYPMIGQIAQAGATGQTLGGATFTKITLDTVLLDNTGLMCDTTNNRINIQRAGNYHVRGVMASNQAGFPNQLHIYKNGSSFMRGIWNSTALESYLRDAILPLAVADVIEMYSFSNAGGTVGYGDSVNWNTILEATEIPKW